MTTTCARCGAEVGDAAACPQCGQMVLSPQSAGDWRTDTAERVPVRGPVEPAPAASTPGPPRFPMYADEAGESVSAHVEPNLPPAPYPSGPDRLDAYGPVDPHDQDDDEGGAPAWLPWAILALVMVLVAVGGIWLLLSPGGDERSADDPAPSLSVPAQKQDTSSPAESSSAAESDASSPAETESAPTTGDPVDVANQATATAPRTAPPNEDAFGNRTTYVAANMLDGSPTTCWRMAGDGTGTDLTFTLAGPTTLTRVGLINGYAKNALVGGRNLNWYIGNRRVLSAQWVFDDGTTVDQPLGSTKQMQTIDLGTPVATSTVTLRLVSVSAPGTGRSARNYTAVSEVSFVGTPSA